MSRNIYIYLCRSKNPAWTDIQVSSPNGIPPKSIAIGKKRCCLRLQNPPNSWSVMLALLSFCRPHSVTIESLHPHFFSVLFPCISFPGLYLSRLLPGSRSFLLIQPPLLDVLMPVEPWFLAAKAKSISLSAQCFSALISSKHHLPKYLCCIHGRCLEKDREEQGKTQPTAW